jgi:O-antigen ligase
VVFYYLLLLIDRFHEYPHLGGPLVQFGPIVVTAVKIVGLLTVISSLILASPDGAAPRTSIAVTVLFYAFVGFALLGSFAFTGAPPGTAVSSIISFAFLLVATRRLVSTETRARNAVRMLVVAAALSTFWVYKQHLSGEQRAWGVGDDPNYEALELIITVPFALWMMRQESSRFWRLLGAGAALALTCATVLTQSRGALVVIPIIAVTEFLRTRGKPIFRFGLVVAFGSLVAFAPSSVWQRFTDTKLSGFASNGDQTGTLVRKELLIAGWRMAKDNPLFGVGLDRYSGLIDDYDPKLLSEFDVRVGVACNTYLQLAAEAGLPALILFLMIILKTYTNCRAAARAVPGTPLSELAASMSLALISYSVASFFLTAWVLGPYWFIVFASTNLREIAAMRHEEINDQNLSPISSADFVLVNSRILPDITGGGTMIESRTMV